MDIHLLMPLSDVVPAQARLLAGARGRRRTNCVHQLRSPTALTNRSRARTFRDLTPSGIVDFSTIYLTGAERITYTLSIKRIAYAMFYIPNYE
jgi:hypothetical protein